MHASQSAASASSKRLPRSPGTDTSGTARKPGAPVGRVDIRRRGHPGHSLDLHGAFAIPRHDAPHKHLNRPRRVQDDARRRPTTRPGIPQRQGQVRVGRATGATPRHGESLHAASGSEATADPSNPDSPAAPWTPGIRLAAPAPPSIHHCRDTNPSRRHATWPHPPLSLIHI